MIDIDIFIIRTKENTYTYYLYNDKIFETNISYNYHRNRYLNYRDKWNLKKDVIIRKYGETQLIEFD